MIRGHSAAFAALYIIGVFIICQCAGTTSALRLPGCPHKSKVCLSSVTLGQAMLARRYLGVSHTIFASWTSRLMLSCGCV